MAVLDDLCRGSVLCGVEWLPFVDCVSASQCGQCINETYLPVSHCSHAQRLPLMPVTGMCTHDKGDIPASHTSYLLAP